MRFYVKRKRTPQIIIVSMIDIFAILLIVLKRTRLGLDIRAVSQNRAMAQAMGIRTEWVDAMTFGLGSGIAGVAGGVASGFVSRTRALGQIRQRRSRHVHQPAAAPRGARCTVWRTLCQPRDERRHRP